MSSDNCQCNSCKPCEPYSYAQYGVQANPPSNSDLPMSVLFQEGGQIALMNNTEIVLVPGYLYLVDFIFLATPGTNSYMQITPKINGSLRLLYSFFAPSGTASGNTSASGSFTIPTNDSNTILTFSLTYPNTVTNIDISGAISVTMLHKIKNR